MISDAIAKRLLKRIKDKTAHNHAQMDKGAHHEEYMKLVGRNAQLAEVRAWINEEMGNLDAEEFDGDD